MKNNRADEIINNLIDDLTLSSSDARNYLTEHGVDSEEYIQRGLKEIESIKRKKDKPKQAKGKTNEFFKRLVLAGKIVDELHMEPTFGRVKLQKIQYLSEHVANMELTHRYLKEAAGPFDNKFMFALDKKLSEQNWFKSIKKDRRFIYLPLDNSEGYKKYYPRYYSNHEEGIQWLIDTFRKWKTVEVELVATIHYCVHEMKKKQIMINERTLIDNFYSFNKSKRKFEKNEVLEMNNWMVANGLYGA